MIDELRAVVRGLEPATPWGPTGEVVYERTYSRKKADGTNETWPETVCRVARGNLALVHGDDIAKWSEAALQEYKNLTHYMMDFRIIPAGRHLWASGVKGRQYLFNCHVSGWGEKLSDHFEFTFMRLMEGGGVGANYSSRFLEGYGAPRRYMMVHIVCDPEHPDYQEMKDAGLLSGAYDADWHGAFAVEDSREGWAEALVDLVDTYMTDDEVKHDDRVYDVSRVRAKGARLKTFGGTASGPAPFAKMMTEVSRVLNRAHNGYDFNHLMPTEAMEIDHAIAECVVSGGVRRSARMAICHWNDPYIYKFLSCKMDSGKHWTTNISIEIDNEFIAALDDMEHPKHDRAVVVHHLAVKGMLTNGEPGYWNSSLSNVGEPNEVIATNPCGEIALEAWENCNLGHINLDAFTTIEDADECACELELAHKLMTRFLIRATYGDVNDSKQADKLVRNRRIGVGHLGVQGFLVKNGVRYSEAPEDLGFRNLLRLMKKTVRDEARSYAFELRIPEPVKTTTVAPTGSIAKLPGVSEGIHPIFARYFIRRVRFNRNDPDQFEQMVKFATQGYNIEADVYDASGNTMVVEFPTMEKLVAEVVALGHAAEIVESADEISLHDMLAFQEMYQTHWADNAVSFTVNVPAQAHQEQAMANGEAVPEPTAEYASGVGAVLAGFLPTLKGTTLMVDGSRPQAPYERITQEQYEAFEVKSIADGTDEDCANGACPVR